jgi:hypothetical protein
MPAQQIQDGSASDQAQRKPGPRVQPKAGGRRKAKSRVRREEEQCRHHQMAAKLPGLRPLMVQVGGVSPIRIPHSAEAE